MAVAGDGVAEGDGAEGLEGVVHLERPGVAGGPQPVAEGERLGREVDSPSR